ncbi:pyridoxal-dependent decarboxylase, exosortase A system-associated [Burkholderia multivorans]|uniref:Pyridoxal-dependent decarboxylase, exosortase A system-associated n=1 Tax=Burkholderia multivorans TaxID=87883 RepID=A0AB37AUJ1_9BURK|nr:pyridoxal-dependent decarboxylase, exosortase A system-associated [Burkholderia multivorans]PRE47463.1 pyridoxal-dependent decarboxylase, exosortase A system-associated [Burkholderia multivorans]PRE52044.1 pyridoxal-dependent decarboxylase, exosortase A system-associated [Burkholderia multivorans]
MNHSSAKPGLPFGGADIRQLAERAGRTPFFAYDRAAISRRVQELRRMMPGNIQLHYSIKANPMPAVIHHLATEVDGFDVASAREMALALDAGAPPADIGFAGPGKSHEDLRRAVACGVNVHVESETQLRLITALGWELGVQPRVAIRINPDFQVGHSGMRMGGGGTPFGVDVDQVPALLHELETREVALAGFHIFWGSQCLHAPTVIQAQRQSVELIERLAADLSVEPGFVNLGGGFGIPYFPGEMPLDIGAVCAAMHGWHTQLRARLPDTRTILELGRYLVGEAGLYVCRVIDRKVSGGKTFVITDGGLHHHLAASGNFGQVLRRNFPVFLGNRADAPSYERCHVVGCLCTPLDRLADDIELPESRIGDFVVIRQSGAYGRSASPEHFLGHPAPVEMLV